MTEAAPSAALFAALTAAAYAAVAVLRRWAETKRILDIPNERSSHSVPTPRGGGIAIAVLSVATFTVCLFAVGPTTPLTTAVAAAAAIAFIGLMDDLRSLSWQVRFAVQTAAAVAVTIAAGPIAHAAFGGTSMTIIGAAALPLTVAWVVGLTNAYNFMDGIDGISGIQAVVAGMAWVAFGALHHDRVPAIAGIALAATAAGFLIHNWPPARIFMGDVGSGFLGFSFAAVTIIASIRAPTAVVAGVMFVWPFLFDSIFTFLRRLGRGEHVFSAHRSHLYQRLVIAGATHRGTSALYGALAVGCAIAALALEHHRRGELVVLAVAVTTGALLLILVHRAERSRSAIA